MILLDTHVVWWLAYHPEKLSSAAADAIQKAESRPSGIGFSAASLYEITWLLERGRIVVSVSPSDFLQELRQRFLILPIEGEIAVRAAQISAPFHGDPMDRLIVATALESGRTLITADSAIRTSAHCSVLW